MPHQLIVQTPSWGKDAVLYSRYIYVKIDYMHTSLLKLVSHTFTETKRRSRCTRAHFFFFEHLTIQ